MTDLADDIFADLRRRILAGELRAGERLTPERELAERYRTNRNTLREAVSRLEHSRLVSVRQGQGVTVQDFRRAGGIELLAPFLEHGADVAEKSRLLADLLPARTQVVETAVRLAAARADDADLARLRSLCAALEAAFHVGDRLALNDGYHAWLDALVDAARSVPVRWVANPFLDASRALIGRFPDLWMIEPSFPAHLSATMTGVAERDAERAVAATRAYYEKVDRALLAGLSALLGDGETSRAPAPKTKIAASPRRRR